MYNRSDNFDVSLLDRYLGIYDAIVKASIDHMPERMIGQSAVASREGRVDEK